MDAPEALLQTAPEEAASIPSSSSAASGMHEEDDVVEETVGAGAAEVAEADEVITKDSDDGRPQSLPLASASKIMSVKLQEHGFAMSKEARETVSDAATIFILYLATTYVASWALPFQ
jgi:hypothetical protein